MTRMIWELGAALSLTLATGCGSDDKDEDSGAADCDDPSSNPYAGTCVETYLSDCWDPSGECEGVIETTTGNSSFTWENGAQMTTEVTVSGTSAAVLTTLYNSGGVECAVAETVQGGRRLLLADDLHPHRRRRDADLLHPGGRLRHRDLRRRQHRRRELRAVGRRRGVPGGRRLAGVLDHLRPLSEEPRP